MTSRFAPLALSLILAAPLHAQQAADSVAPEAAGTAETGFAALPDRVQAALDAKAQGRPSEAREWMIAAANPLAVEAGAKVLEAGGSAADAMIAVQSVLGLVEPQSSGLGGGAFLVWYDAESGALTTLDGRETAPLDATPQLFQDGSGQPLGFFDAVVGGRSVGTPGTPRLLEEAHRRWGRANWGQPLCRRHHAGGGWLHRLPAPRRARGRGSRAAPALPRDGRLFLPRGHGDRRRRPADQPGLCRHPPPDRRQGRGGLLHRAHCRGHRRARPRGGRQPGRPLHPSTSRSTR
jgi:hypothetical protein